MGIRNVIMLIAWIAGGLFLLSSCNGAKKKKGLENFHYEVFRDSISIENYNAANDTANVFDAGNFTPGYDSLQTLLLRIDSLWHGDVVMMMRTDSAKMKKNEKFTAEEKAAVANNVRTLDYFLNYVDTVVNSPCKEKECTLYAEVIKSTQKLYLYIDGELKDSFKVSTGIKKYETPDLSLQPRGPLFIKYKSKKFPGGNYQGLGNMPYAVFLRGGYAIHGTTQGNFAKLGQKASHGCIRLHPNNAVIFYELVKKVGLAQTWVSIKDSLP